MARAVAIRRGPAQDWAGAAARCDGPLRLSGVDAPQASHRTDTLDCAQVRRRCTWEYQESADCHVWTVAGVFLWGDACFGFGGGCGVGPLRSSARNGVAAPVRRTDEACSPERRGRPVTVGPAGPDRTVAAW
ncbi:hypothetical protein GCM10017581_054820 [Dactylosporangium matsuzakiense]|uniref:Uncharacterized protein n=1 Tax=Dactylosporangium matsuzakiense TaxID=53360 RepID=A0A9W6KKK3_9ACTN|nr:hypothetical protein GCM10017581_054820 [Dactylosporangium matsuzakiense]